MAVSGADVERESWAPEATLPQPQPQEGGGSGILTSGAGEAGESEQGGLAKALIPRVKEGGGPTEEGGGEAELARADGVAVDGAVKDAFKRLGIPPEHAPASAASRRPSERAAKEKEGRKRQRQGQGEGERRRAKQRKAGRVEEVPEGGLDPVELRRRHGGRSWQARKRRPRQRRRLERKERSEPVKKGGQPSQKRHASNGLCAACGAAKEGAMQGLNFCAPHAVGNAWCQVCDKNTVNSVKGRASGPNNFWGVYTCKQCADTERALRRRHGEGDLPPRGDLADRLWLYRRGILPQGVGNHASHFARAGLGLSSEGGDGSDGERNMDEEAALEDQAEPFYPQLLPHFYPGMPSLPLSFGGLPSSHHNGSSSSSQAPPASLEDEMAQAVASLRQAPTNDGPNPPPPPSSTEPQAEQGPSADPAPSPSPGC